MRDKAIVAALGDLSLTLNFNRACTQKFGGGSMHKALVAAILAGCATPMMAQVASSNSNNQNPSTVLNSRQVASGRGTSAQKPSAPEVNVSVPADANVVTIEGICEPSQAPAKKTSSCKTAFTRARLEGLMNLLNANGAESSGPEFAVSYARLLAASTAAERQHLDKDPEVAKKLEAKLKYVRMQVLSEALYRKLAEQADEIDLAEMQKYYADHQDSFEEGVIERLSFPQNPRTASGSAIDPTVLKAKASELRARAIAGEDFDSLQQVAYKDLGIISPVPATKLDKVQRANLTLNQGTVFDLQPGQMTELLESYEGFVILKLDSKQSISFDSLQLEIHSILRQEHLRRDLESKAAKFKGDFNLSYLQTSVAPSLFPPPGAVRTSVLPGKLPDPRARSVARRRKVPVAPQALGNPGPPANPAR
jgi:hypothetical protein